jgi:uncharacterized repeat protein (TIGR02543 family)
MEVIMKKTTKFISMILSFLMIISSFNFAFALPNAGYESLDLQKVLESRTGSDASTELFIDKNVGQRVFDFNSDNLIRNNMKETLAKRFNGKTILNAEEKRYVEDVASSLSKPVGAVDIDGSPNEYIDIIVWLQELPTALKEAYGNSYMSLTSSYEALGSKARLTIKSKFNSMSKSSSKSSASSAIKHEYFNVFAGFAMTVTVEEANEIAKIAGVYAVIPDTLMYADKAIYNPDPSYEISGMAESRKALGIGEIHAAGIDGKGVIVGVLDTGIDYNHPDLKDVYKGGWNYIEPDVDLGRGVLGELATTPMETTHEQWVASGQVEIENNSAYYTDHGTHVSGTIAARALNTQSAGNYKALGMAPNVDLYVARVLGPYGSGATSGIIAAVEDFATGNSVRGIPQADVINLSLGANKNTAYGANVFALNSAVMAGVNVSVSAGNNGDPGNTGKVEKRVTKTLGNPGTAYLPVTVAASQYGGAMLKVYDNVTASNGTENRSFGLMLEGKDSSNILTDGKIEGTPSPIYVEGKGYELYLAFADSIDNYLDKLKAISDNLEGKILVVERGISFLDYIEQAKRTKASALIIVNNEKEGEDYIAYGNNLNLKDKNLLIFSSFYSTNSKLKELASGEKTVYVELGSFGKEQEKLPAYFSSIGPVNPTEGLKPDIIAPGWDIVSTAPAFITAENNNATDYSAAYQSMSGTSMSAPHIAGILALMKQRYPDATPSEIKARLMNTSKVGFIKTTDGTDEYEASVYEVGAGFVDPYRAIIEEYEKDIYVTVTDDIPGQTTGTVIEDRILSSLSFGSTDPGVISKLLPVKVNGVTSLDVSNISVIYNNNTRYSKNSTENQVELKYSTPINGEFNVWIESTKSTTVGYYEGYLSITVDGKEYTMPWLIEIGNVIEPVSNLLSFTERPIISTSTNPDIRSAGNEAPINSNSTTLHLTWSGTFTTNVNVFLINAEADELDLNYYCGTLPMNGKSNDGTEIYSFLDSITNTSYEMVDGKPGENKTVANGIYYLVLNFDGEFFYYDDVGVVFTDGTGEYAVELELDTEILVNSKENITTANISGRIFSPALQKASDMGFIWLNYYDFWIDGAYYNVDQTYNVLGFDSKNDIYGNIISGDLYNVYANKSGPWICDEDGYFSLTMNIDQNDKNGGYPFDFNGNHSVVGVEGFYFNCNRTDLIMIGANKSAPVTPQYIVGPSINIVSADFQKIIANITTGSAITGSAITGSGITARPTVNSINAEYTIDGGKTYSKLALTSVELNDEETEIEITYEPIVFTTQKEVTIRFTYLEEEYVTDSFDSGVAQVVFVYADNDYGILEVYFDYNPYIYPEASEFNITCEGGYNPADENQTIEYLAYLEKYGAAIFGFTPYEPAHNQEQDVTFYVEFNEVTTASYNTIKIKAKHNITFNLSGGKIENVIADNGLIMVEVLNGEKVTQPADPTRTGYKFEGWYKNVALTEAYDFVNDIVTEDITIYAKWAKIEEPAPWVPDPVTPTPGTGGSTPTTPTTPQPVVPVEFNDTTNHWAKDDIGFIAGLGLVNGTSAGNFSPDSTMNRGMIVTILGRLAKIDPNQFGSSSSFNDVAGGQYYAPFIEWAAQLGLVNGTGNGGFSPEAPLTREQLAHMLMKYAELMNLNLKSNTENKVQFADEDKVSSYASESVQKARELGIIIGSDNSFAPDRTITRAEVITMLARFIKLIEQQ